MQVLVLVVNTEETTVEDRASDRWATRAPYPMTGTSTETAIQGRTQGPNEAYHSCRAKAEFDVDVALSTCTIGQAGRRHSTGKGQVHDGTGATEGELGHDRDILPSRGRPRHQLAL